MKWVLVGLSLWACNQGPVSSRPDRRGGRGDPCLVVNDCKEPLLCIGGLCLDPTLSERASAKVCALAQCVDRQDCCPPLTLGAEAACEELRTRDGAYAQAEYERACVCTRRCEDHVCVESSKGTECEGNADCSWGRCVRGRCVECAKDEQCGEGFLCLSHACQLGCRRDTQCGALEACVGSRCVARDCRGDRECIALLDHRAAVCRAGECLIACSNDAGCSSPLQGPKPLVCREGGCRDLGCEGHEECKLAVPAYGGSWPYRLCLPPEQADALREAADRSYDYGYGGLR